MTHNELNADEHTHQAARIDEINGTKEMIAIDVMLPSQAITDALADGAEAIALLEWLIQGAE
jgi:hypothetical protein